MLELQNLEAGYGHLRVLFGIDLSLQKGELLNILGANGAGKSTLLKAILGAIPATGGEIIFRGERITHLAAHQRVVEGISLSPEGRQVFPSLTVKENLIAGTYGVDSRAEIKRQMEKIYELFPRLAERQAQRAGSLSGGEQQMLAVGRALMSQPLLLLVDELSLGLAPIIVDNIYTALRDLCARGLSVIVVEQSHQFREGRADRNIVLEKGRFVVGLESEAALLSSVAPGAAEEVLGVGGEGQRR